MDSACLDLVFGILALDSRILALDSGFPTLDFGFLALDSGFLAMNPKLACTPLLVLVYRLDTIFINFLNKQLRDILEQ